MLSLQGLLEEQPFPRLLNFLHETEQTGRLVLKHSGVIKTLYFVHGLPVNVESSLRDETLGRFLIKKGKITEEEYQKSIELMMGQGIQQGASLVKIGALKPKELYQSVKEQSREKVLTCFGWKEGNYRYTEEISFIEDMYRFEINFIPVMLEGLSRFFPDELLETELSLVPDKALVPNEDLAAQISSWKLSNENTAFLSRVDGETTLGEIIPSAGPAERRILYLLLLLGLIKPGGGLADEIREVIPGELHKPTREVEFYISESSPELFEETEEPTGAEAEKKGEDDILAEYMEIKSRNYFSLLGVSEGADDAEIEEAYRTKIHEFSRDNFTSRLSPEAEARLEEINTRFIRAYESLKTHEGREKYSGELSGRKTARPRTGLEAEKYLQRGMESVRSRDWANAQEMFEKAIELRPEEPEYYGYLGWVIYSNESIDFEERRDMAIEKLAKALEMNPNMDSVHVFIGKIFKDDGKSEEAIAEFRLALQCNPNCREAARELKSYGVEP